jgi:putative NIF3 family GTP cyclohydrolase 1 type 2
LACRLGLKDLSGLVPVEGFPEQAMGRVGLWPNPQPAKDVLLKIKECLCLDVLPYAGDTSVLVNKVAVLGGAGASFIDLAQAAGAQLYVTGDVRYHDAQHAIKSGIVIADGGHFGTEIPVVEDLKKRLIQASSTQSWNVEFIADPTSRNMLNYF